MALLVLKRACGHCPCLPQRMQLGGVPSLQTKCLVLGYLGAFSNPFPFPMPPGMHRIYVLFQDSIEI